MPLGDEVIDEAADDECAHERDAEQRHAVRDLEVGEAEGKVLAASADEGRLERRHDDARGEEQGDNQQHPEREALLLEPAAAPNVVDAAEGGVHRAPERGPDPDGAERRGDPDRRGVGSDAVEGVAQCVELDGGKQPAQVVEDADLDVVALDHAAEDEEHQECEREERQEEVVGDHGG